MRIMGALAVAGMALAIATLLIDPAATPLRIWVSVGGMLGACVCGLAIALHGSGASRRQR